MKQFIMYAIWDKVRKGWVELEDWENNDYSCQPDETTLLFYNRKIAEEHIKGCFTDPIEQNEQGDYLFKGIAVLLSDADCFVPIAIAMNPIDIISATEGGDDDQKRV